MVSVFREGTPWLLFKVRFRLFWEPVFRDWTSVALGSINGKTGLQLERHIFVAHKADYYSIGDGLPQNEN